MKIRNGFVSNSSSSCFILNYYERDDYPNYTVEQIEENLNKMLDFYKDMFDRDLTYCGVFQTPKMIDDKELEWLCDWLNGDAVTDEAMLKKLEKMSKQKNNQYKSTYRIGEDWYNKHWDGTWKKTEANRVKGKMMILSQEDNSIPYELFDVIENKFNSHRFHLG